METIPAKSIVTRTKSPMWFDIDYTMNIYRGCCHGCIYCDSRSECYRIEDFDTVRAKENAIEIISQDLSKKRSRGVIATGSMSDPYNPFEENELLTRQALELVDRYRFGIAIATKSTLVVRDIDLLLKISTHSPVIVKITITSASDELSAKIEPNAPSSSQRFEALGTLRSAGIYAGILMMPILPYVNDTKENILGIVNKAHRVNSCFISPSFGVTLRSNQREHYYRRLDAMFPNMSQKYISRFGGTYSCNSVDSKMLYNTFKTECQRLGMIYKMGDIIREYKRPYEVIQRPLF